MLNVIILNVGKMLYEKPEQPFNEYLLRLDIMGWH